MSSGFVSVCLAARQAPECGTLTSWPASSCRVVSTARASFRGCGGVESRRGVEGWLSTLLGPEGSATCVGGSSADQCGSPVVGGSAVVPPVC